MASLVDPSTGRRMAVSLKPHANNNRASRLAHLFVFGATVATFMAFEFLDPEPNWILSTAAALNVSIISCAIFRLYELDLLLSPMASVVAGPGLILYYSWGNLGARIAGEGRYGSNPGSLAYYPEAALLTTIGLALFCLFVFALFPRWARHSTTRYQDLSWSPRQALLATLLAAGLLIYLSLKYNFVGGYFRDVVGTIDRWLSASQYFFVQLALIIGVSVMARASRWQERVIGGSAILLPLIMALGLRSRTFMITATLTATLCWITLRPKQVKAALLISATIAVVLLGLGTVVKVSTVSGRTVSIWDNLAAVSSADFSVIGNLNDQSARIDSQYRLAGFEFPATLLAALTAGASPMYGEGAYQGLISGLPGFVRPSGAFSERQAIYRQFRSTGLLFGDSIGVPLTSGIADLGAVGGPLIYIVIAIYCLGVWRIVQTSPRLFVAYLVVGAAPSDLFWENAAFAVRAIGFVWLLLFLTSALFMPNVSIQSTDAAPSRHLRRSMSVE